MYLAALEKIPQERPAFLAEACAGDAALRQEVESLLAYAPGADQFLQAAVREVASQASSYDATATLETASISGDPPKLGRYQVIEKIGMGGMGVVYRAIDPAIGRTVAVKTILASKAGGPDSPMRTRLLRESQAVGRLSHPNIVAVYDVGEEDATAYIVMEYVQGRTLAQVIHEQPAPQTTAETIRIVQECAAALDYAHSRGVVHRDIKPANIMLQADGTVKVTDFGIAKLSEVSALTQTAVTVGSPDYMAPEQWRGEAVTGKADQYALASVAYAMLTGRRPFESDSLASMAAMTLYQDPPAAVTLNARLSPKVDEVLRKALSKVAETRYGTCTEFALALCNACEGAPGPANGRANQPKWMAVGGAVSLAVCVSLAGWLLYFHEGGGHSKTAKAEKTVAVEPPRTPPPTVTPAPVVAPTPAPGPPTARRGTPPPADAELEGERFLHQGNYAEAVKDFTRSLATNPDYRSYFGRASAYRQLQEDEKAVADYSQAIALKPDSAAYYDRAVCRARLGLDDAAADDYDHALQLDPANAHNWNGRGVIYLKKGGYKKARDCFTRAIELDGTFADAYKNRAKAKLKLDDPAGAKEDTTKAESLLQASPKR